MILSKLYFEASAFIPYYLKALEILGLTITLLNFPVIADPAANVVIEMAA
ncbi:hypothetical protein VIBC2010_15314 [Vibrio caribbeanicus ATCC BAA-2122]|uniref:Uncharacterized protein n=1 Tax=Vibrio caribbeanicus ATCC BAA-2122 TaxID=796620 RepID=E3BNJ7_9VIBR|nr:hypothetical protein VIBC2010_15314 [Vibrio caribbeanicus ATCC BAA-2122]